MLRLVLAASLAASVEGALFFSEYFDSEVKYVDYKAVPSNKYVEIYNSGPNPANLANYFIGVAHNGFSTFQVTDFMPTRLDSGEVFVVAHSSASGEVLSKADVISPALYFNGNDAVCLLKGTIKEYEVIDCVGRLRDDPGADSGWNVCGVPRGTNEMKLIRKGTVTEGNKGVWEISAAPATCEWDVLVNNEPAVGGIGEHWIAGKDCECVDDEAVAGAPARRRLSGAGVGAGKQAQERAAAAELKQREQSRVTALVGAAMHLFGGTRSASASGRQLLFGGASYLPPCPSRLCV